MNRTAPNKTTGAFPVWNNFVCNEIILENAILEGHKSLSNRAKSNDASRHSR